jgi:hypothetical protein
MKPAQFAKSRICLTMIVRNEEAVIGECLQSVLPYVDSYAIIDTGSQDQTLTLIREQLNGVPGEVRVSAWRNDFSFHRNEALALAAQIMSAEKGFDDWVLFLDADEKIIGRQLDLSYATRTKKSCLLWYAACDEYRFLKVAAIRMRGDTYWRGAVHESLGNIDRGDVKLLPNALIQYGHGRRRSNGESVNDDVRLLKEAKRKFERNFWTCFHLARTYESQGEFVAAIAEFSTALKVATTEDEYFQAAWGQLRCISADDGTMQKAALTAQNLANVLETPRAEPYAMLAEIALRRQLYVAARQLAHAALRCRPPRLTTMYDAGANTWKPLLVLAKSWAHTRNKARSRLYYARVLNEHSITGDLRAAVLAELA